MRWSGKLNCDLGKSGINLVPFQRLHFFAVTQAPPFGPGDDKHVKVTINVKHKMINIYQHHVHLVIVVTLQEKNYYQIMNQLKREQDIIHLYCTWFGGLFNDD